MTKRVKYDQILDALQKLMEDQDIQNISVSQIAKEAGIGKGSIYYYFSSKEKIMDALVERNYEKTLDTAKALARQTDIPPFTRMAMLFQACRTSSLELIRSERAASNENTPEKAFIHQKYLNHLISELKPSLSAIISQAIENGEVHFDHPDALAEIVLIVLAVKIDNTLVPSDPKEIEETIQGLIELLEKGTGNPPGALNYLTLF